MVRDTGSAIKRPAKLNAPATLNTDDGANRIAQDAVRGLAQEYGEPAAVTARDQQISAKLRGHVGHDCGGSSGPDEDPPLRPQAVCSVSTLCMA